MGGGRDNSGASIYIRRNGVYLRRDGKEVKHSNNEITELLSIAKDSKLPTIPQSGREVAGFLQQAIALDDLNDKSTGNFLSKAKRKDGQLYQKLIDGRFDTPNGGFLFQDNRDKNRAYLKYNDMPSYKDVLNQIIPQLTPSNLREVIPSGANSTINGKTVVNNLWAFETFVTNNKGERIRTYAKVLPFISNSGKPYAILVSLHRTGEMRDKTTDKQKGLV